MTHGSVQPHQSALLPFICRAVSLNACRTNKSTDHISCARSANGTVYNCSCSIESCRRSDWSAAVVGGRVCKPIAQEKDKCTAQFSTFCICYTLLRSCRTGRTMLASQCLALYVDAHSMLKTIAMMALVRNAIPTHLRIGL